jgi:hypothetical protein
MKTKLKSILPSPVPSLFFTLSCVLLLALGAASLAQIQSIAKETDNGLAMLELPDPMAVASFARVAVN